MSAIKQEILSFSEDSGLDYDSPTANSQADSFGSRTNTPPSSRSVSLSAQHTPSSIANSLPNESGEAETDIDIDNVAAASATPASISNTPVSTTTSWKAHVPENFVPVSTRDLKQCSGRNSTNTELWLVQVPHGFDVSVLDSVLDPSLLTYTGSQTVKVKAQEHKRRFSLHSYRDSTDCKKMSMVVADSSGHICVGQDLQNMLVVTETFKPPHHATSSSVLAPKKPVPMPSGLKVRFTTFGAGTPCPSSPKKSKKRKKESTPSGDELTTSPKKKPHRVDSPAKGEVTTSPKKKHSPAKGDNTPATLPTKSHHTPAVSTPRREKPATTTAPSATPTTVPDPVISEDCTLPQISPRKSIKRKWDASFSPDGETSVDGTSPPKKKKKRNKHRHSEPMDLQNGGDDDVVDGVESVPYPPEEQRKVKVKEDTSFADGLFMVDRGGSRNNMAVDSLVNLSESSKKHKKKSNKDKKERRRTVM